MKALRTPHDSLLFATVACILVGLGTQSGCATAAVPDSRPGREPAPSEQLFPQGFLTVSPGEVDAEDSYPSAAMVLSANSTKGGVPDRCSGVLLHPRMLVTAAHCVCARRAPTREDVSRLREELVPKPSRRAGVLTKAAVLGNTPLTEIIDARSPCAGTAAVRTASYVDPENGNQSKGGSEVYFGKVLVHPDFEILFGATAGASSVVWSNADLAAIILEESAPFKRPGLALADSEVEVGATITMVGFSYGATSPPSHGIRHFGENRVNRLILLETGSAVFRAEDQQLPDGRAASHTQRGDSGGACIKKGARDLLVGISTVGGMKPTGERLSFFTSVYPHRRWLLQMLELADRT